MRYLFSLALVLSISSSCQVQKEAIDIGDHYTIEYDYKNSFVEVYRSSNNNRKLNGQIIRRAVGQYDTTLNFTLIGEFEKGVLNGNDSIFRNDTLIRIENYVKGVKHGDQIEIWDSIKTISPYTDGVIHGFQRIYNNNRIQKKSYFNQGVKDSVEYFYDSLGQVATTFNYHLYVDDYWDAYLALDRHDLISSSFLARLDTLTLSILKRAAYRGTIVFYSYDPKGIGNARPQDVVHESIANGDLSHGNSSIQSYFYIIRKNTCVVCDYFDHHGIWVAYHDGIELEFYELRSIKLE